MKIDLNKIKEIDDKLADVANKILLGDYPPNHKNCKWCDLKEICNEKE